MKDLLLTPTTVSDSISRSHIVSVSYSSLCQQLRPPTLTSTSTISDCLVAPCLSCRSPLSFADSVATSGARLSLHRLSCVDNHPLPSFVQNSFTIPPSVCRSLTVANPSQSAPMLYHTQDVAEAPAPVVLPGGKCCSRTSCCLGFPSFRFPFSPLLYCFLH